MNDKVQLKMVAGGTYACPAFRGRVLSRGDTVTVDAATAAILLEDGFYDIANNFHHYFVAEDGEAVEAIAEGEAEKGADGADGEDGEDGADGEGDKQPAKADAKVAARPRARTK